MNRYTHGTRDLCRRWQRGWRLRRTAHAALDVPLAAVAACVNGCRRTAHRALDALLDAAVRAIASRERTAP